MIMTDEDISSLADFLKSERLGKMKEWQERVIVEQKELAEKIFNLDMFLGGQHNISPNQLLLLKKQVHVMREYSAILYDRITDFTE